MQLFVSDVHLNASRPGRVDAFVDFLAGPARGAAALHLLGDVFDEWLGDDDRRDPHPRILDALAGLTASGVPVTVLHGNHDFLIGEAFCAATGCELLEEPARIEVGGEPALLMHGDVLCTRDVDYQAWRAETRDPARQHAFLSLPLAERAAHAAALRHRSRELTEIKPEAIMDVTEEAVAATMREHGVRVLIHGHTHRPALHRFALDGEPALRAVLGDWYSGDSVLVWDTGGPRLAPIAELAADQPGG